MVDLEVSAEEAAAVAEAQRYMQGFRDEGSADAARPC